VWGERKVKLARQLEESCDRRACNPSLFCGQKVLVERCYTYKMLS
jgi:hypothetical protein